MQHGLLAGTVRVGEPRGARPANGWGQASDSAIFNPEPFDRCCLSQVMLEIPRRDRFTGDNRRIEGLTPIHTTLPNKTAAI